MKRILAFLLCICPVFTIFFAAGCKKEQKTAISYDISAAYDEQAGELCGTVDFCYNHTGEGEISSLKFNLWGNAFREGAKINPVGEAYASEAYYGGPSYGEMSVQSVEGCADWEVGGEDMTVLTVNLNEPLSRGDGVRLTITYTLKLARVNHRTGISESGVNLGNFYPQLCGIKDGAFVESPYYPCGDPFYADIANYRVTLDVPEGWTVASSGSLVSEETADGRKKCQYTLTKARDFAAVISDGFEVITKDAGGVKVSYYYTADESAQAILDVACESLEYFCETFGDYVYPTLSVVSTGFYCGGMEYPALTMINEDMSYDNRVYTAVHENAHQWWYAMVGSDQICEAWQDEGLTEYSTLTFFENHPDYGFTRTGIMASATRAYRAFFSVASQLKGVQDTSMSRNLGDFTSDYEYTNVTYNKGLILFDTVRKSVGDEKFFDSLKRYYDHNLYRMAGSESLKEEFSAGGKDVGGIFDSFLQGKIII